MKDKKGEAAFESIDEVLAEKIVDNAQRNSETAAPLASGAEAEPEHADQTATPAPKKKKITVFRLLLAIGAAVAAIAIILHFTQSGNRCRGK